MKLKGRIRLLEPGVWSPYPATREEAFAEEIAKFWPRKPCPTHGGSPVVFTRTEINGCCAQLDAVAEFNRAMAEGEPISFSDAKTQGTDYYWKPQEHNMCGHVGKTLLNGTCYECNTNRKFKSPRQAALAAGEMWYTPAFGDVCDAGHHAERRVSNGVCRQCEENAKLKRQENRAATKAPEIYETCPDMVISREDAKAMGFLYYRTGKPCRAGHTGWRYVSTNNCIDCRKEG